MSWGKRVTKSSQQHAAHASAASTAATEPFWQPLTRPNLQPYGRARQTLLICKPETFMTGRHRKERAVL